VRRVLRALPAGIRWIRSRLARVPRRPLVVFALAFTLLEIVETYVQPNAPDGIHFQNWSSETLMQSVSVRELRRAPLESLWYLHIQPPIHNAIRAIFAGLHHFTTWPQLVNDVDRDLYHAWALIAAVLAALVDAWLRRLEIPSAVAAVLSLSWFMHPANLGYATLLDATLLSAFLTTWIIYEVWRLSRTPRESLFPLGAAVLLAYFTRSLYQWPFVAVIVTSLLLLKVPLRRVIRFGAAVALVVGLYSVKQAWLFGTVATSSFRGTNLANAIAANCGPNDAPPALPPPAGPLADVLAAPLKTDGTINFNHVRRLGIERNQIDCFRRVVSQSSLGSLWKAYAANFELFIKPSSSYCANPMIDRAPGRRLFDELFSGRGLLWISLGVGLISVWRARRRLRAGLAVLLPVAYVFVISVTAERGENMRFKFFLEPAIYVWWTAEVFLAARALLIRAQRLWLVVVATEEAPTLRAARDG
jgi:hypothetical protein